MERYFDAFFHFANWGTRTLALRLPKEVLPLSKVLTYATCFSITAWETETHTILKFNIDNDDVPNFWKSDFSSIGSFMSLRGDLASGDYRSLYLGWLMDPYDDPDLLDEEQADDEEILEPPVPPGLANLSPAQEFLVEFFEIDRDLLAAATAASPPIVESKVDTDGLKNWIVGLNEDEKDEFLLRVATGSATAVAAELGARFNRTISGSEAANDLAPRRTVEQLFALSDSIRETRIRREQEAVASAKKHKLDRLAARVPAAWAEVDALVDSKKVNLYKEALKILTDLQGLEIRGDIFDFTRRVDGLRLTHRMKHAFLRMLDEAHM
jgi:hypothetical protein